MYERDVKQYCRRASSLLTYSRAQRQAFDRLIARSVQDYLQEQPDASWPEVEQMLGSPEDAAAAFMETLPPGTAEHWAGVRKRRLRLVVAAVCLVFALMVGVIAFFWTTHGVALIETQTTIVYEPSGSPFTTAPPLE